jgi:hypothetical protein
MSVRLRQSRLTSSPGREWCGAHSVIRSSRTRAPASTAAVPNDVTRRVGIGEVGYVVEFGRPTVGVRFRDIEQMTRALAGIGIEFEPKNPVTHLMSDVKTGKLRDDILNEKILSAIVEFKTRIDNVPAVLSKVDEVARTLATVVAIGVSTRCGEDGDSALEPVLAEEGFSFVRGKTNLGLGRSERP